METSPVGEVEEVLSGGSMVGKRRFSTPWRAAMVTGVYGVFAGLWIVFSDRALALLFKDPQQWVQWSVIKGMGFVVVTSALLYGLMRWLFGAIEKTFGDLVQHEKELERFKRLYAVLSQINQAIVWTKNREELLNKVCKTIVQDGGFRMAWIGWNDPVTHRMQPIASWGDEKGYLGGIEIYTDDRREGRGPTGTAFRTERPSICNDMLGSEAMKLWRRQFLECGFRACGAFPIREDGALRGMLNVYSDEVGFFQDKEVALLEEAAGDISFALDNLKREEARIQAEGLVRMERRFSETMIESMPGVLYFYDMSGRFLRWNRSFEEVTGYSGEEIAKMHPLDFFRDEDKPLLEDRIAEVFEKGESSVEALFVGKEGRSAPYFFTGRRVDFEGRLCLVGVGIDISERIKAEEALKKSEHRYRTTLDNILEACQLVGFDWRYLYLNHAAETQNRRPNIELLGRTMQEAWPGIDRMPVFAKFRSCLEDRIAFTEEVEFVFPDGHVGWFDVRAQPVPEGMFILSVDITERHAAEKALRELNEGLELKVAERTAELATALVRAEAADRIKSAFLATMSHELRTPLNSIIGFTGIVLQGLAGPLNEEQTKQLRMVQGSSRHLLELINDVLDLSKIEAGQLDVKSEPFDLPASLERVVASVRPLAEKKGLTLDATIPRELGQMIGDRRRLEQVLLNLLNNAIKFTEEGVVRLVVEMLENYQMADGRDLHRALRFSVSDTGMGIKEEDIGALFQPFHQIDSGITRQHEGTGLGLTICRKLAELMGGEIGVESEWLKGSTFCLTVPQQNSSMTA